MFPNIKQNESVEVGFDLTTLKSGDVLVFYDLHFEKIIAHRIIAFNNTYFICKGDNFEYLDPPVHISQVIGIAKNKYINLNTSFRITFNEKIFQNMNSKNILICSNSSIFSLYDKSYFDKPIHYSNENINYIISNDVPSDLYLDSIYYFPN